MQPEIIIFFIIIIILVVVVLNYISKTFIRNFLERISINSKNNFDNFLEPLNKKPLIKKEQLNQRNRCMSRVWNNGYGGQCCRRKKIINYDQYR